MRFPVVGAFLFCSTVMLMIANATCGQEFRIETEVFADEAEQPVSANLTLFSRGLVYDFLTIYDGETASGQAEPEQIVIYDRDHQKLVMIDVPRQVKLVLSHDDILRFNAAQQARPGLQKKNPFLFNPQFNESFDAETGWLTLSSPRMEYRVKGYTTDDKAGLSVYQDFANWYVRLNAIGPGKMPPFARLELNKAIAARNMIPEQVELSFKLDGLLGQKIEVKSRHYVIWKLSETDRKRIESADAHWVEFEEVSVQRFYNVDANAER